MADKGITELVNVFTQLEKDNDGLVLILVGEYEDALDPLPAATLQEIKINPSIIHINWTNKVEYYLHLAQLFIFPSHREGFPNVLLQAGAMQLPIICSRIPGNVDIVTDKKTGLIFDCGNQKQLLQKILYALEHPMQVHKMAQHLHVEITENYQQEIIWQNIRRGYYFMLI